MILAVCVVFFFAMALTRITQGHGVVKDDPERNIVIPTELQIPLQVQAAYNDTHIFFRYRWPTPKPALFHDVAVFQNGQWVIKGKSGPGPQKDGMQEDRLAMMLDNGGVPGFEHYGGYLAIGPGIATFRDQAPEAQVKENPYWGQNLGESKISKSLPDSRTDENDWSSMKSEDVLLAQRKAGYFLDLWHWRSHRSNPIGMADDQYIDAGRLSDSGKSAASTNWDDALARPKWMFDDTKTGYHALKWDDIQAGNISQESTYFLREGDAVPFDPNAPWTEGDTLPRRILRQPEGSQADISVQGTGRWKDGFWDVTLTRKLDTGNPLEDKALHPQGHYWLAFSVHRNATAARWHYISLPASLGLDSPADLVAHHFKGDTPTWKDSWFTTTLYYPGQVNWPLLTGKKHAGASAIRQGQPVTAHHTIEQLMYYGIESEFADAIYHRWLSTMLIGLAMITALGFALTRLLPTQVQQGDK